MSAPLSSSLLLAERHGHPTLRARDDAGDRTVTEIAGESPRVDVRKREIDRVVRDHELAQRPVDAAQIRADQFAVDGTVRVLRELELDVDVDRRDARPADPS